MICDKIICVDRVPQEEEKLFFGDSGHVTRSDKISHQFFQKIYEKGFADFWTWKVVDFSHDAVGWESIEEKGQRIFLLNNAYQTLMDSGVYNEYFYILKFVSNSELATLYSTIGFQEVIHANSYSYGLAQMFGAKADEKFNLLYEDEVIKSRLKYEVKFSSDLAEAEKTNGEEQIKLPLAKTIVTTLFLEKVKFPNSFFTTWAINDYFDGAIQGFSQILKLIAYDELTTHVPTNIQVLKTLLYEKNQGFAKYKDEIISFIYGYIKTGIIEEDRWIDYLLKDGEFGLLTKETMKRFIRYQANDMLRLLKLKPIYSKEESDIAEVSMWFKGYYDINSQNNANQELSNISYKKGVVKNDINKKLKNIKGFLWETKKLIGV